MRLPQKCSFSLSPNLYSFIVVYIRRLLPKAQWTRPLIFHTAPHTLIEGQDCSTGNRKKTPKRILLDKKNFFVCLLCHGSQHRCDDCCIRDRKCFASKLYFQKKGGFIIETQKNVLLLRTVDIIWTETNDYPPYESQFFSSSGHLVSSQVRYGDASQSSVTQRGGGIVQVSDNSLAIDS